MDERFDYERQLQDDECRQQEYEPDPYWLSEMKRLKDYYEALKRWTNGDQKWP